MGKGCHRVDVMILAAADFLTGFVRKFHGSLMRGLPVKIRQRLIAGAIGLMVLGFSTSAMALAESAPMVQGVGALVCKLQDVLKSDGEGQSMAGVGASFAPSSCRMLRVTVRIATGSPSETSTDDETVSSPRRLGNASDTAEYQVDVCENATGLMLFDEHHPYVRQMLVQGGRNPGYGQEIDYVNFRHGFTVHPTAAGKYIRLLLDPWFGRESASKPAQTLQAPEVESLQMSTTLDVVPGQWMELGTFRQVTGSAYEASTRRILGNSREVMRIWVRVDDINLPDRSYK